MQVFSKQRRRSIVVAALLLLPAVIFIAGIAVSPRAEKSDAASSYEAGGHRFTPIGLEDLYLSSRQNYADLINKGFRPRKDVPYWRIELPIEWDADPYGDENWQFQLHAWRMIDPIIREYVKTGDASYLEQSAAIALDWKSYHQSHAPTDYSWYDMSTGLRSMHLAFLLDESARKPHALSGEVRDQLLALAEIHIENLRDRSTIKFNNHSIFELYGLSMLCEVLEERSSCRDVGLYLGDLMNRMIDASFTEEGVHKENSPEYQQLVMEQMGKFFRAHPDQARLTDVLSKAKRVTNYLYLPDGQLASIGDTSGGDKPAPVAPAIRCLSAEACYDVGDFTKSGYAIIRSVPYGAAENASDLIVTGMSHSYIHKHADELSFVLFEFGRLIFVDSGKYSYEGDVWQNYFLSADAHNTIGLADRRIDFRQVRMKGTNLEGLYVRDDVFEISGAVERPGLFSQSRSIRYAPGSMLEISDHLRSLHPREYVSSLHLAPGLTPILNNEGFKIGISDEITLVARLLSDGECSIQIVEGAEQPILGWYSTAYRQKQPISVVRAVCPGRVRNITWRVTFENAR